MGMKERGRTPVATNRKARHLYVVLDTVEAGIVLVGNEVKSLRLRRASLGEAFATVDDHEMWLHNLHIAEYSFGTWTNHEVRRKRKLLLHRARDSEVGAGRPRERIVDGAAVALLQTVA